MQVVGKRSSDLFFKGSLTLRRRIYYTYFSWSTYHKIRVSRESHPDTALIIYDCNHPEVIMLTDSLFKKLLWSIGSGNVHALLGVVGVGSLEL
jgi:hypothetical protein